MKITKCLALLFAVATLSSLTACKKAAEPETMPPTQTVPSETTPVEFYEFINKTGLEELPSYLVLGIGGTGTVPVADTAGNPLTWSSADTEIASVDASGLVCGLAEGETSLDAVVNGMSTKVLAFVTEDPENFLRVEVASIRIPVGLVSEVPGVYWGKKPLIWVSYDLSIVDFPEDGVFRALREGTTKIAVGTEKDYKYINVIVKSADGDDSATVPMDQSADETTAPTTGQPDTPAATTKPVDTPTTSTNPTKPTGSNTPTNPTTSTSPTTTTNPTSPTNPTKPTNPTSPTNPTKPTNPTTTEPTKPSATLKITTSNFTLEVGGSKTVSYSYTGNKSLTWSSSNSKVATVSNGTVKAVSAGNAVITVSDGSLKSSVSVTVKAQEIKPTEPAASLKITSGNFTLEVGSSKKVSCSYTGNKSLSWSSSNTNVATVSNGTVKATGAGTAVITVTDGNLNAQITVTVNAPKPAATLKITTGNLTMNVGDSKSISYSYTGNKSLSWSSSNTNAASVTGGTVKAAGAGTAVITVTDGSLNAQITVTVNAPKPVAKLELSTTSITMYVGETKTIGYTYTGTGMIRFETDFGRVSVDSNGNVTALSVGTDYVYVTDGSMEKCCTIDVKDKETVPTATNIDFDSATGSLGGTYYVGNSLSFVAVVMPSKVDRHVSVSSSNNGVATVSANHAYGANTVYINFVGEGSVTITVTSADGCASKSLSFEVKTYEPEIPANELTPEQYARAVVNAMVAAGLEEASGLGGWNLVNVPEGELTNADAYSLGTNFAANLYAVGCTQCNCVYIGKDGNNYQFYIQF